MTTPKASTEVPVRDKKSSGVSPWNTSLNSAKEWKHCEPGLPRVLRALWSAMRLALLGALALMEPVVRIICSLAMVFGVVICLVFEISIVGPQFPFLRMLALSVSFGLILSLYYVFMVLLSS
jgi:hypothetical protein